MKWIKVSEQLPIIDKDALLWNVRGFHIIGRLNNQQEFIEYQHCDEVVYQLKDITHWIDLPEGPDEVD